MTHTPLPLPITTALKTLSGDDLKVMVLLCYQTYNCDRPTLTLEQIEALGSIPRHALKPSLNRLMRRSWIVQDGPLYRLALQSNAPLTQPIATYDPALGIRPPRVQANLLYPDGPWLTETGFLQEDFVRDRAEVWQKGDHFQAKAFGAMAIEDVMGIICKHYAKYENHANLEIDWHSYCLKNQRYLQNVKQRLDAGIEIQSAEQANVLSKLPTLNQAIEPVYAPAAVLTQTPPSPTELPAAVTKRLSLLTQSKAMPSQTRSEPREMRSMDRLDRLNLWIQDPILRKEAVREAKGAGFAIAYSEAGIPTRVMDLEDCEDF
jgi:hypothetical protein